MNNYNYISHSGILGQRWGIRRYQYQDGSLTPEGKIRYGSGNDGNSGTRKGVLARFSVKKSGKNTSSDEKKRPEDMTNEELRAANERMKLLITNKEYEKKLAPAPVKTLSQKLKDAGKAYVKQCIKETGDKVAKEVIAPYLTNKVKNELKSHDADKRKKTNAANAAKALDFKEKEQKKNDKEQKKNDKAGVGFV